MNNFCSNFFIKKIRAEVWNSGLSHVQGRENSDKNYSNDSVLNT